MQISRSEQKRRVQQLEQLAAALVALPAQQHVQLPGPPELSAEVHQAAAMKGGARKRQLKYLAKLLRTMENRDELYHFIDRYQGKALSARREQRQLEQYRNALIAEALEYVSSHGDSEQDEWWESPTLQEVQQSIPGVEGRALLRLARRFAQTRDVRHSREIFRTLKSALEREKRNQAET